ncbi:hypothetical protein ACN28C_17530 [Plantactinospora sp. WMMC1484]|uniref:hypothetical protein n=1 Tax=Plantactinospora sp. WMMC1484 TaxID=3404122 RepID=UPI003BF4CF56
MRSLRSAASGLVLVAALGLAMAGCGNGEEASETSAQPGNTPTPIELSPVEKLADAAAKTNQKPLTVVVRGPGATTEARLDPDAKKATMKVVVDDGSKTLRVDLIQIDADLYMRAPDLPGASKKWMHSVISAIPADSPLRVLPESDHSGVADLVNCVVTAERKGGREFAGTLDLTRSRKIDRVLLTELGARAKAVPFSALTSPDGNFFEFTIDIPSVLPSYSTISYEFSRMDGVDAERPAASEVTKLPKSIIDQFDL